MLGQCEIHPISLRLQLLLWPLLNAMNFLSSVSSMDTPVLLSSGRTRPTYCLIVDDNKNNRSSHIHQSFPLSAEDMRTKAFSNHMYKCQQLFASRTCRHTSPALPPDLQNMGEPIRDNHNPYISSRVLTMPHLTTGFFRI